MADQDFNIKVVTTADTTGLQKTSDELRKLRQEALRAAVSPVPAGLTGEPAPPLTQYKELTQTQRELARLSDIELSKRSSTLIATAAIVTTGHEFISVLHQSAAEIEKITNELAKQGAQIVANAQQFSEMAKFATKTSDVIRIGEGALKGVEVAHKNLLDISQKELTVWQKIADVWAAGFKDKGPIAQALELQQAEAQQNYQMERTNAIREITAAKRTKDDLATKGYAESVDYLTNKIKEQQDTQKRVGVSNIEDYLKAGKEAENYRQILEGVNAERRKEIASAGDRTQKIIKNEQLASAARKYGRFDEANALDIGTQALKESATGIEMAEYNRLSGRDEAKELTRKRQEAIDLDLERQRAQPSASYKTAEQIGREEREKADAAAREKAGSDVEKVEPVKPIPKSEARPSAAPTPSPDVVQAIQDLGDKFDRYWA